MTRSILLFACATLLLLPACEKRFARAGADGAGNDRATQYAFDVESWRREAASENSGERQHALWSLQGHSSEVRAVLPDVLAMLDDPSAEVRETAVYTVGNLADDRMEYFDRYVALLDDSEGSVAVNAIRELGYIGPRAAGALPQLILQLQRTEFRRSSYAAMAIWQIDPQALLSRIDPLVSQLSSGTDEQRRAAALALGSIGACPQPPSLSAARAAERDPFDSLPLASIYAGYGIAQSGAAPKLAMLPQSRTICSALVGALKDPDDEVRHQVVSGLVGFGENVELDIETLVELTRDSSEPVRNMATMLLATTSTRGSGTRDLLLRLLSDDSPRVRGTAVRALPRLVPLDEEILRQLKHMLRTEPMYTADYNVGTEVIRALGDYGPDAEGAVPDLVRIVAEVPEATVAVEALGKIGPHALEALDMLREHLKTVDQTTAGSDAIALVQINPEGDKVWQDLLDSFLSRGNSIAGIVLADLTTDEPSFVSSLLEAIEDAAAEQIPVLLQAAGRHAHQDPAVVSVLVQHLRGEDDYLAWLSASLLISMLRDHSETAAAVQSELRPWSDEPRPALVLACATEQRTEAAKLLEVAMADTDPAIFTLAVQTFNSLGLAVSEVNASLLDRDNSADEYRRFVWASLLATYAPDRLSPMLPELTAMLTGPPGPHKEQAAWMLGRIGPAAAQAIPNLKVTQYDMDENLRNASVLALARIQGGAI